MKRYFIFISFLFFVFSNHTYGQSTKLSSVDSMKAEQAVAELNRSASLMAKYLGEDEGLISCDPFLVYCTCQGAIDCAWLALACGEVGGIQGFDGECYLPGDENDVESAVKSFASVKETQEASCEGIFCSCNGPSDSDDCNKLKACIDDISCIGDDCGCIGGHVD